MMKSENPFRIPVPEESPGFLLWQVNNLWQREIRKALIPFNLTHSQFVLMASIHWHQLQKQVVNQVLISRHTKVDTMTTSTVLRGLQKKGLVLRKEHGKDSRSNTVELTDAGRKVIKKAVVAVENFDAAFFSMSDKSLKALIKLLAQLNGKNSQSE